MSGSLREQLNTLIKAKQYQAAIVLLEASNRPDKQQFIDRIRERMKTEPAPAPLQAEVIDHQPRYSVRGIIGVTVFALVLLVGGALVLINQMGRGAADALQMQFRMEDVCKTVYEANYLAGAYTAHQFVAGCGEAAGYAISGYREAVEYCFDQQNDTEAMFTRCLADNDVKIEEVWILTAPKE